MNKIYIIALLCIAACSAERHATEEAPASQATEPAAIPKSREAVVFIGDSITDEFKPQVYPYINAGIDSQTSAQILQRFDADVIAANPRAVVILAGTNDLQGQLSSTANVQEMAERAASHGICVIIGTVPPCDLPALKQSPSVTAWNSDEKTIAAAYGYKIADYYAAMAQPDGTQKPGLFYDMIHPSKEGVAVMLGVAQPLIDQCP